MEGPNKGVRRRTDVVGIVLNRVTSVRPVGAVMAEQHDEWWITSRDMIADAPAAARDRDNHTPRPDDKEPPDPTGAASPDVSGRGWRSSIHQLDGRSL